MAWAEARLGVVRCSSWDPQGAASDDVGRAAKAAARVGAAPAAASVMLLAGMEGMEENEAGEVNQ